MSTYKRCPHCGTTFEGRANKVYCSAACKLRVFRQQQAEPTTDAVAPGPPRSEVIIAGRTASRNPPRDTAALRYQAQLRKAELAHELEMEKLRLAAQEKVREHELRLLVPPAPPAPPVLSLEVQRQQQQAAREAQEKQQRDRELIAGYGRVTEEFLDAEGCALPAQEFEALLDTVREHETALRKHSGVKDPTHPVRACLEHLDQMKDVLQGVLGDLAEQGPSLFGPRLSGFTLKKGWRHELRNSLLDLA